MKTVYDVQKETEAGMAADLALHNRKMAIIAEIKAATARRDFSAVSALTAKLHEIN